MIHSSPTVNWSYRELNGVLTVTDIVYPLTVLSHNCRIVVYCMIASV